MTETADLEEMRDFMLPTNIMHDRRFCSIREIIVATDLSVQSRKAINYAVTLARTWNAHLTLLYVYQGPYSPAYMRNPHVNDTIERQRQYTKNALQLFGERAREQYARCNTQFREGNLCDEIVKAVKDLQADLIIVGTHGSRWIRRIALGSEADEIVRLAPCPVLVVRTDS